jgi:hypothetical protein
MEMSLSEGLNLGKGAMYIPVYVERDRERLKKERERERENAYTLK